MRFTYRKIETALDRVSRAEKAYNSKHVGNSDKLANSFTPMVWLVVHGVLMLSMGFLCAELYRRVEKKSAPKFEKVRVTYHEEPIEKHQWLDEKIIEIKTISW